MTTVWVLADDRMGNVNQLLGIAESLNEPFERKDIAYTKWVKLHNFLRRSTLIGITKKSVEGLKAPWPDVVLSAGRRSFPVALNIKKRSGGKTKIVQMMNPGATGFKKADLIVLPYHDNYRGKAKNVLQIAGAPHRITPQRLSAERQKWEPVFADYARPRLSLIVGGTTKDKSFTKAAELVKDALSLNPQSILVTTSRRTPADVVTLLQESLPKDKTFFYRFGDTGENPYFGLMACADMIVVTGDSISMCSECCASGVPVYIFAPDDMIGPKHKRFVQTLYQGGYAAPLGSEPFTPKGHFNPADTIAERIKALLK